MIESFYKNKQLGFSIFGGSSIIEAGQGSKGPHGDVGFIKTYKDLKWAQKHVDNALWYIEK